jgi:multiple antibiotic resistance protein
MVEQIVAVTVVGFFLACVSALFTIMNPFSTASVFLSLTQNETVAMRRRIALKSTITAACVLIAFAAAGSLILNFFGITVDAFRIAGGLLIARVGFNMLYPKKVEVAINHKKNTDDISLIPLAIPSLSGPGAMTTAIVLMGEAGGWMGGSLHLVVALFLAIMLTCALAFVILRQSIAIQKYIGEKEQVVIEKILGLIVMVVGVQFIINGIAGWLSYTLI